MRSFAGDPTLKQALLAAIDERIKDASLEPLVARGQRFAPYDYTGADTYVVAARVLHVPEGLLRLGARLFEGFPEDRSTTLEHLRDARTWLAEIPVGADLRGVTQEFAVWRLTDEHDGMVRFARWPEVRAALEEVALALVAGDEADRARARQTAEALAKRVGDEIPAQWRAERRVDGSVYEQLRALQTALYAVDVRHEQRAAVGVADASVEGAFGCGVAPEWYQSDAMARWLLSRLRA